MHPANPLAAIAQPEDLAIAHRQWIRADKLKRCFQAALARNTDEEKSDPGKFYLSDAGTFMLVWYGVLFSVLELVTSKGADLSAMDRNFNELYNTLRLARNSIFQAEKQYWDERQIALVSLDDVVQRIHNVHDGLGGYFLDALGGKSA